MPEQGDQQKANSPEVLKYSMPRHRTLRLALLLSVLHSAVSFAFLCGGGVGWSVLLFPLNLFPLLIDGPADGFYAIVANSLVCGFALAYGVAAIRRLLR
jgi:hypothetical protein